MAIQATFSWNGLTLTHRTVLTGSELAPEYALVRVRRALEDHRGDASGQPSDGHLEFDEGVSSISLTGALLPAKVRRSQSREGGGWHRGRCYGESRAPRSGYNHEPGRRGRDLLLPRLL